MQIHHVEIYSNDCDDLSRRLCDAFGLTCQEERGSRYDRRTYWLKANRIVIAVTMPTSVTSEVRRYLNRHGEGVRDVAIAVPPDCASAILSSQVENYGYTSPPQKEGAVGTIHGVGDVVHSIYEQREAAHGDEISGCGLTEIDHVALAVGAGELDGVTDRYKAVLGLDTAQEVMIDTGRSGMRSRVLSSRDNGLQFPMMEPSVGAVTSQIQEFVSANGGSGVQHVAIGCADIISTAARIERAGFDLLPAPNKYYDAVGPHIAEVLGDIRRVRQLNILCDRDEYGYLLQVFTRPIANRGAVFLELIERRGARGFGGGNIRSLFEAVEKAQVNNA